MTGTALQKVTLDPSTHRGGLLTHGSVAVVTSPTPTTRTSPTKRGKWVLLRLLCSPPPDPPPNVPSLDAMDGGAGPDASIRDRLLAHASHEPCKSCHASMDPIGFAFEHYDGIGAWRDAYPGGPIDATGTLPDGTSFDGVAELAQIVKKDPKVVDCVARTAMTYALGRDLNASDEVAVGGLVAAFGQSQRRMTALLTSLVASQTFRMRVGAQ